MNIKKRYILLAIIIALFILFLLSTKVYAGSQKLNDLNYEAKLNEDGSVEVTEIWNIRVEETNTLFKTFNIDRSKYTGISDVKVSEILKSGDEIQFKDTQKYAYHVEKGGFYALARNAKEFEIAWGVSIDNAENKIYKISYTILDAVKTYNDCSEFYWQFIGTTNGVPAKKVTGTIKLPSKVVHKNNLRVWAHGPLNGNIEITDEETVNFEVENLKAETMLEVRIVSTENIFMQNQNILSISKLDSILKEENHWAEEANRQRKITNMILAGAIIIGVLIAIFFISKIIKYTKELSRIKQTGIKPEQKLDYFRDFPDENATPGEAAFLYYFDKKSQFKNNISKVVSGIILDLALKKIITFKENPEKRESVYIEINKKPEGTFLQEDENKVLQILLKAREYKNRKNIQEIETTSITMKDIENYAKKNDTTFLNKIESIEKIAKESEGKKGNYSAEIERVADRWTNKAVAYWGVAFVCLCMGILMVPLIAIISCAICGILCGSIAKRARTLTQAGENEQERWQALKRYMEDFSLLNEREVPELVLWEKYLVYATAFGVADKVISQLKVKYPQILDENYMMNNGYTYIYMTNRINFERSIIGGMQRAYTAGITERASRNYSSGGGFGGGFSGGGRRSEAEAGRNGRKINLKVKEISKAERKNSLLFVLLKTSKKA